MDLPITIDPDTSLPLHRQLYEALRQAILTGRLLPRQRIPSTRELAKSLGISRTTVTQSYEQLLSEGYLETIVGSGTYVCAQLPDDLLYSDPVNADRSAIRSSISLSKYGTGLTSIEIPENEPDTPISFRYGRPAFEQFPMQLWRKLLSRHCRNCSDWLDYATDPMGYQPLREAIAHHLSRFRAVQCKPEQVLITNGTQQALSLIVHLLIDPGDAIALEDPGYLRARFTFISSGATLLPISVDESGLIVRELTEHQCDRIKLVYVTPSHQFPTGAVLSLPRRFELLAWAQQQGAMIIEDDYDSEFRYGDRTTHSSDARPIPALQGLDQSNSVFYVGTFSKVLFPSLRIGYLVLPLSLVPIFALAKRLNDRQLPTLEQHVLTDFITEGHLERHIRRMRNYYNHHRQILVQALENELGDRVTIFDQSTGLHLMARLYTQLSDMDIIDRAAQVGVGVVSTQPYYLKAGRSGEFIFGYSDLTDQQIQEGIRKLAKIV